VRGRQDPEALVPPDHPIQAIRRLADDALAELSSLFDRMDAELGRPSIPPERLLKASLLMALYSVRSERAFCEQLGYNLLFRWFLGVDLSELAFDHSTFSKNRARLMEHKVAREFFDAVVRQTQRRRLLSEEHFTVDGTLLEAAASPKSFKPRADGDERPPDDPGNPTVNWRGQKRSNATHASTTDPQARLARKGHGREARLSFAAHALMENRHGLLVDFAVPEATGTAERDAVPALLDGARERGFRPKTLGAEKSYDTVDCVAAIRARHVTPHVAQHTTKRRSAVDGRTRCWPGYALSQRARKRVEEVFGWMKTVGGLRRTRYRGVGRTGLVGYLVAAAYNLVRRANLLARPLLPAAA
jgi:transposase